MSHKRVRSGGGAGDTAAAVVPSSARKKDAKSHKAFELVPLFDKLDSGKVEAVEAWASVVWVGSSDGHITRFTVQDKVNAADGKMTYKISRTAMRQQGRKAIDQMFAFGQINRIVVLADGVVSVVNATTLEPCPAGGLAGVRGASHLAGRTPPAESEKHGGGQQHASQQNDADSSAAAGDLDGLLEGATGAGEPSAAVLRELHLCVAVKRRLLLFRVEGKSEFVKYREINLAADPVALGWVDGGVCVGNRREYLLFDDETGQVRELFRLEKGLRTRPHVKPLPARKQFMVATDALGVFFEVGGTPSASKLEWTISPVAVAASFPYFLVVHRDGVDVYNIERPNTQEHVQNLPLMHASALADRGRVLILTAGVRVYILGMIPLETQWRDLLRARQVNEALRLFELVADPADPDWERKELTMHYAAGFVLFSDMNFAAAVDHLRRTNIDPRELISFFPHHLPSGSRFRAANPLAPASIQEIVEYSLDAGGEVDAGEKEQLVAIYVPKALACVANFLEQKRDSASGKVKEAIDTALVRMYTTLNTPGLEDFVGGDTSLVLDDVVPVLTEHRRYAALALAYRRKGRVDKALEVWLKLGTGVWTDNAANPIAKTVEYLRTEADLPLIERFAPWVLAKNATEGMRIFTDRPSDRPLPAEEVLKFVELLPSDLVREKTLLLGTLARHRQALELLVKQSVERSKAGEQLDIFCAVDYCRTHAAPPKEAGELEEDDADAKRGRGGTEGELVLDLLRVLLAAAPDHPDLQDAIEKTALWLVVMHARIVDPLAVLDLLPPSLPLSLVCDYLGHCLPAHVHRFRDGQVTRNLERAQHMRQTVEWFESRRPAVSISSSTVCARCGKRLGDRVFALRPDGSLLHFMCHQVPGSALGPPDTAGSPPTG